MFNHYLTTALRHFSRHRVTTIVSVLCLSVGIACFVAAYAVVGYLRSSEAAFPNSNRTYFIAQPSNGVPTITPQPVAKYLRVDFPELVVARATGGLFSLGEGHSIKVDDRAFATSPVFVDAEFLEIFPLRFIAGERTAALSNPNSVVLTEQAALKYFGTTDVVGRFIALNREPATVTGVVTPAPQPSHLSNSPTAIMRFEVLASMDVYDRWAEKQTGRRADEDRWGGVYLTYVQLPSDGSLTAATLNERLTSFSERRTPEGQFRRTFVAQPIASLTASLGDVFTGSVAALLMGLGGVVLLVACLNYANLATAQAANRAREVGMRKVLGATWRQLMGQHLFETALLTLAAAFIALAAAIAFSTFLSTRLGVDVSAVLTRGAAFWVFLVGLLTSVSVLAGAYPAFVLARLAPAQTLRAGRGRVGGKALASALVGVQFAVASLLVIAVVAIYRQNVAVRASFKSPTDQLVVINTNMKNAGIALATLRSELMRSPAVESVSAVRVPPWSPAMSTVRVQTTAAEFDGAPSARINAVADDFFVAFEMKLLAGRTFDSAMDAAAAPVGQLSPNVVVDRQFVSQLGFESPTQAVNRDIYYRTGDPARPTASARIVGVVETQQLSLIGMGVSANVYTFDAEHAGFAVVRLANSAIPEGIKAIESSWRTLAPDVALSYAFADQLFERGYRYFDGTRQVFTGIAIFAFAIAAMGLIGMAVHIVGNRRHEIGVRKTLGATQQRVLSMLMWDFSKPVLIANLIAWPLAFGIEQLYARVIVDRAPLSLLPYVLGLLITLAIAWAATGTQAYRAARLHPATVLRHE
jgi:putative ABC transport system permease protein